MRTELMVHPLSAFDGGADLQPGSETRVYEPLGAPRGSVVLLHGFSAGTWQFDELGPRLAERGLLGFAPRLPGHGGRAGTRPDPAAIPGSGAVEVYDAFADRVFEAVPKPTAIVGLSGGAAIGARVLERHEGIERAVLMAPFFAPRRRKIRRLMRALAAIDRRALGLAGRLADRFEHQLRDRDDHRPGHPRVSLGQIYALSRLGARALADAHRISARTLIITTALDWAVDNAAVDRASLAIRGPVTRIHFDAGQGVPHAMLHSSDHPDAARREGIVRRILEHLA